jgi:CRISPR/Cas system CSM-associated protein Csm2 small subunit
MSKEQELVDSLKQLNYSDEGLNALYDFVLNHVAKIRMLEAVINDIEKIEITVEEIKKNLAYNKSEEQRTRIGRLKAALRELKASISYDSIEDSHGI